MTDFKKGRFVGDNYKKIHFCGTHMVPRACKLTF